VKRLVAAGTLGAAVAALLLLPTMISSAQEPPPARSARLTTTLDLSPIQNQLASLRTEVAELRKTVADPKGLRGEIAQAAAAVKGMDKRLTEIATLIRDQSDTLEPVVTALDPATRWEYRCLRTRSEAVANRLAREGWQLVTASGDWLYFKRLAAPAEEKKAP
jgi:hypothetical protein